MRGKRGQFTIFVILGFVLVATFAFMFFARGILQEAKSQTQANEIIEEAIKTNNINFYVKSCIDRVSDDAIYLLSLQSGRLYQSQGGSYPNLADSGEEFIVFDITSDNPIFGTSFYENTNVSYGILANTDLNCVSPIAPHYPLPNTTLVNLRNNYHTESYIDNECSFYSGALGVETIPKLCEIGGQNSFDASERGADDPSFYFFGTCKNGEGDDSVQEQLQTYISNAMVECVNFSIFEEREYNITVNNSPTSTITFSDKFFMVNVTYPFEVKIKGKNTKTQVSFEQKKNLRFKQFYEYIQGIMQKEYKSIEFSLERDGNITFLGWDPQISILKKTNPCAGCDDNQWDDIYQIVDETMLIRGNPLIFQIVIQNRAPVLDYIDFGQKYNIVAKEGDEIQINPVAIDPDGNTLIFDYGGWRQDYYETLDEERCLNEIDLCRENIQNYMNPHILYPPEDEGNWTESMRYFSSGVNASYKATREDLGLHFVQVYVYDEEGLIDFQNISILVGDNPVVRPDGLNIYDDIPDYYASVEDPYNLTASPQSFFTNIVQFRWYDVLEDLEIFTQLREITIPRPQQLNINYLANPTAIEDINELDIPFTDDVNHEHVITVRGLYYDNGIGEWTPDSEFIVNVRECLPHRSEAASYPYNYWAADNNYPPYYVDNENPFMGNHSCCDLDTYEVTGGTCYEYWDYGSKYNIGTRLNTFAQEPNGDPYDSATISTDIDDYINQFDRDLENDIFNRTFTRACDGTRGNICTGTPVQDIPLEDREDCPDYDEPEYGPDERCQGPAPSLRFGDTLYYNPECYNYNYNAWTSTNTFEQAYGLEDESDNIASGECNKGRRCVTSQNHYDGYNYIVPGNTNYHCGAVCFNGECSRTVSAVCDNCGGFDQAATDTDASACGGDGYCLSTEGTCTENGIADCIDLTGCYNSISSPIPYTDSCELAHPGFPGIIGTWKVYIEYYPSDENGGNGEGTCAMDRISYTHNNQDACEACEGVFNVGIDQCCGDELGEFATADNYCCENEDECSANPGTGTECYSDGETHPIDLTLECDDGSWETCVPDCEDLCGTDGGCFGYTCPADNCESDEACNPTTYQCYYCPDDCDSENQCDGTVCEEDCSVENSCPMIPFDTGGPYCINDNDCVECTNSLLHCDPDQTCSASNVCCDNPNCPPAWEWGEVENTCTNPVSSVICVGTHCPFGQVEFCDGDVCPPGDEDDTSLSHTCCTPTITLADNYCSIIIEELTTCNLPVTFDANCDPGMTCELSTHTCQFDDPCAAGSCDPNPHNDCPVGCVEDSIFGLDCDCVEDTCITYSCMTVGGTNDCLGGCEEFLHNGFCACRTPNI